MDMGLKWPGREGDHVSASSAKVKNEWSCTFAVLNVFMACTQTRLTFTHFLVDEDIFVSIS
jgi:hypothetical protein